MSRIKDDFKAGDKITSVTAAWLNSVAAFCNYLKGVNNIVIRRPQGTPSESSPVEVEFFGDLSTPTTPAEDPGTSITTIDQTGTTAGSTTWTAGGTNGCKLKVQTRTRIVSSIETNFFVWVTLDKYGRVYSVSAEQSRTFSNS